MLGVELSLGPHNVTDTDNSQSDILQSPCCVVYNTLNYSGTIYQLLWYNFKAHIYIKEVRRHNSLIK